MKKFDINLIQNYILFLFIFGFMLIYLLPVFPTIRGTGLDPSWTNTINYALINNMPFGKQIIFTFGPLGSFRFPGYVFSEQTYNVAIFLFNKNKELA